MLTVRRPSNFWRLTVLSVVLAGCGGGDDASTGGEAATAGGGEAAAPVQIANPGVITGTISFAGTAPTPAPIDMREEPTCAAKHSTPPTSQAVMVKDGKLQNVFIYVKEGLTQQFPKPADPKEIDQDGCMYIPHILGMQVNQDLVIKNADAVLHNINTKPTTNRGFNISQPQAGMTSTRTFTAKEVMIPVQCDVHGWMQAYIGVLDHPYFAVSGEDGAFRIENLPPGNYVVEAWHEQYGAQTLNVTVPPDGTVDAPFNFSPATASAVPLGEPVVLHMMGHAG
jgi:hypothetical protein